MPNSYDGKKLEQILNPSKNLEDNDAEAHRLVTEIKEILNHQDDEDSFSLYAQQHSVDSIQVRHETEERGKRNLNLFYGGWAALAFGGEYMNKLKEWWKK